MKKLSFINRLFLILNVFAATSLILSYLARYISPEFLWPIAFFGIAYPVILAVNILFLVFWALQGKKFILISLFAILAGLPWLNSTYKFPFLSNSDPSFEGKNSFKLMTFNVRCFDLYNWTNNTKTRNKIFDLFVKEKPDVYCLQEFFHSDEKGYFTTLDTLYELKLAKSAHIKYTAHRLKVHHWGIAIFSNYPILNKGTVYFGKNDNNVCIYADLKINDDTVRIYNVHLTSVGFQEKDYQFVDDLVEGNKTNELENSRNILILLKNAFIKRSMQAELVAKSINKSPYPVIVCGDFNDTPFSYTYRQVRNDLKDAFSISGNGMGNTYAGRFPSFRIDYILHSKDIKSANFQVIKENLSDHYPVTSQLRIAKD